MTLHFGVIGHPIGHSRSPAMMKRACAVLGVRAQYEAYEVAPHALEHAVRGLHALGFAGYNVTIPHKRAVCAFLDVLDDSAQQAGAVNTVVVHDDGRTVGYNTDGIGYVRSLLEELGTQVLGRDVLILGAGGAARGVAYAVKHRLSPKSIAIANRTRAHAEELARALDCATVVSWDEVAHVVPSYGLIINTTSIGMVSHEEPCSLDRLRDGAIVSDIVYRPTQWLAHARMRGGLVHGGIGMLVHQGAEALEMWLRAHGMPYAAPIAAMREAVMG
jgi:shikimate dehydrogenase